MYSLSLSVGHGAFRCGVLFENVRQLEVRRITILTRFILLLWLWFETGPFVVVVCAVELVFLFFVAPFSLLAVFAYAVAFNQDVSNWNMGAVTTMELSKCLSLSLSVATLLLLCFF